MENSRETLHVTACIVCRGVVPFSQRKKMLEKARAKNKKPKSSAGMSSIPNITVGTQVRQNISKCCLSIFLHCMTDICSVACFSANFNSIISVMFSLLPVSGVFEE